MLNELERIQSQKAALEKKEQELKAALRKKLDEQNQRLKKLGVAAPEQEKEPDRVGRIIIEGNTKTSDNAILNLLNVRPGQLLSYPALEGSRKSLEMVGFRGATVEVVPNELDTAIKDIRVRVDESKSTVVPLPEVRPAPKR